MSDEGGYTENFRMGTDDRHAESRAMACLACSLVAVGAMGAVIGLMRRPRGVRRWPAPKAMPEPMDFTAPHGDKLLRRR